MADFAGESRDDLVRLTLGIVTADDPDRRRRP